MYHHWVIVSFCGAQVEWGTSRLVLGRKAAGLQAAAAARRHQPMAAGSRAEVRVPAVLSSITPCVASIATRLHPSTLSLFRFL